MHDRLLVAAMAAAIGAGTAVLVSSTTTSSEAPVATAAPASRTPGPPSVATPSRPLERKASRAAAADRTEPHPGVVARIASLERRQQELAAEIAAWRRSALQPLDATPVASEVELDPLDIADVSDELLAAEEDAIAVAQAQAEDLALAFDGERANSSWGRQAERWLLAGTEPAHRFEPECRETLCRIHVTRVEDEAALHLALGELLSREHAMLSGHVVSRDEGAGVAYYFERALR